jgi:hypothetical protein
MAKRKYFYFRRSKQSQRHPGAVTVAAQLDEAAKKLHLAFSFCSPKDQFVRKIGRNYADDRLTLGLGNVQLHTIPNYWYRTTEFTGKPLADILRVFNFEVRPEDKPRIWQKRILIADAEEGLTFTQASIIPVIASNLAASQPGVGENE